MKSHFVLVAITLLGFGLRMVHLADVPPRWDEGWSVAHAALSWSEIFTVTAADVHPPLYYLLLNAWQNVFGIHLFGARFLSVCTSLPQIALAYVAARIWVGNTPSAAQKRVGIFAALFMAVLPLAVYYAAVVRMYALAPTLVLLAIYALLKTPPRLAPFILGATGVMLTLYHAAWALVGLGLYAFAQSFFAPRKVSSAFLRSVVLAVVCFLPWAIYALPKLYGRAAAETATNIGQNYGADYFVEQGIRGLLLTHQTGELGWVAVVLVVGCGVIGHMSTRLIHQKEFAVRRSPLSLWQLVLPLMMMVCTLIGVALAARQWAFNERMVVCATPALAMLLAWACEALRLEPRAQLPGVPSAETSSQKYGLLMVVGLALGATYFTTSTDFVYRKSLEVFDPYNPHTYRDNILPNARASDMVIFNVLSPAGFFALDGPTPRTSYALTWDPVIEPRPQWERRIAQLAQSSSSLRLWLVLYRGLAGKNGDLRGWMDSNFYPALSKWGEEDVFYGLYGAAQPNQAGAGAGTRWESVTLMETLIGAQIEQGDIIPVALTWQASVAMKTNYKVFVHAVAADGSVIAQHDAMPLNDLRPFSTLPVGELVRDNHGLALPTNFKGELRIMIGLYNPETGARILNTDGREHVEVGRVMVQ